MSAPPQPDEMRAFLMVLRQALLLIVAYIEKRYDIGPSHQRLTRQ